MSQGSDVISLHVGGEELLAAEAGERLIRQDAVGFAGLAAFMDISAVVFLIRAARSKRR